MAERRGWTEGPTGDRTTGPTSGGAPPWSWTTWDWALPAVIAGLVVVEVLLYRPENWPAALALLGASCTFLVTRRRWPLASCVPAGVLCLALPWAGPELDDLASPIFIMVLIAWSLARWLPGHRLGLTALIGIALMLFSDYLFTDERVNGITDVVFASSLLVPPYVFGKVSRRLDEQGRLLVAQQEQIRDQAGRDERDRIAGSCTTCSPTRSAPWWCRRRRPRTCCGAIRTGRPSC